MVCQSHLGLIPRVRGRRGLIGGSRTVIRTRSWSWRRISHLPGLLRLLRRVLLRLLRRVLLRLLGRILLWLLRRILSRFLFIYHAWGRTSRRGKEIDLIDRRCPNTIATDMLEDSQTDENDGIFEEKDPV